MEWQVIVAMAVAIPIILLPVALVWYINIGGIRILLRWRQPKPATKRKEISMVTGKR
jgi:hypothetical protein